MKKYLYILIFISFISNIKGVPVLDSTSMGAQYSNQVFYSLDSGIVRVINNDNWHLAFSVSGTGAPGSAVLINEATTIAYNCPFDTSKWNNFDTTGYKTWKRLLNSDTSWTNGAFNTYRGTAGTYDMGWGILNPSNNFWTFGDSLYLIQINNVFKKLWIVSLKTGVWEFKYANLDGSSLHTIILTKANYPNKNFIYYSLTTDSIMNREPSVATWDLTFQKNIDFTANQFVSVSSVYSNKKIWSAKANMPDSTSASIATTPTSSFTQNTYNLGREWKRFSSATGWTVYDSIAYFLYNYDSTSFYRVVFVGFSGQASGITYFYKEKLRTITAIADHKRQQISASIYPNPASTLCTLLLNYTNDEQANYSILGLNGSVQRAGTIRLEKGVNQIRLDLADLPSGIYLLNVQTQNGMVTQKLIKQ